MTCINTLRYKYMQHGRILRTLIVGPPIVMENWKREFLAHSNIPEDKIFILQGPGPKRIKMVEALPEEAIAIVNYEAFGRMPKLIEALHKWNPEAIAWDESHRCKNQTSKQTKAAIKMADKAQYNYLLSGTPVLNTMLDIFTQFRIMDGGLTLGKKFWDFRNKYFLDLNAGMSKDKYFPNWVPKRKS